MSMMKAILYTKWGPPDVLQVQEIPKPSPRENEVLVRVLASSLNAMEWRLFTFPLFFLRIIGRGYRGPKDKSIGGDLAGRVEAVGAAVKQFRPGDEVFGIRRGAFAEYVCAPEDRLVLKPANVSFEAAASVPIAGLTALQAVRDQGRIQPGQQILINGAGGGVGTFAIQIAKSFATEVTAVCGTHNVDMARSIGADHVIDYTQEDFTKRRTRYDLIIAANGHHPILNYRRALKPKGTYVVLGGSMNQIGQGLLFGPLLSLAGNKKMRGLLTHPNQKDLIFLRELLETGSVIPVIDRSYPLDRIPEAIRYLMQHHARGKVVISIH
jgi:NADPH:quinone reductase-like Zn-dependent oxidoreductase